MEAPLKVFYLADSDFDIDIVRRFMKTKTNWELAHSTSESEALKFLKEQHPDVFMFDLIIKGDAVHNLVELAVKKNYVKTIIPLALRATPEELRFYKALGCTEILNKPFTAEDLARVFDSFKPQSARVQ